MSSYLLVSPLAAGGVGEFAFTYSFDRDLPVGTIVSVPFGRSKTNQGVVVGPTTKPSFATKPISEVLAWQLPPHMVELAAWLHDYYLASPQSVWQTLLPAGLLRKRQAPRAAKASLDVPRTDFKLTSDQSAVIKAIEGDKQHRSFLLHGITGSGKTEVYIELARKALEKNQAVIILVPEITLATQLIARFEAAFGPIVVAQNSRMTEAQRYRAWQLAFDGEEPRIFIGPRSTLFLPIKKLGLIVVDEAHETSYKQEQAPRYQATLAAGKLSQLTAARLVMGSATPSLESLYLVQRDRLAYLRLDKRATGQVLPSVSVVDLRDKEQLTNSSLFSKPLLEALKQSLTDGRQSLLFLNRRGSASSQLCSDCGAVNSCPNCELPLTFHADHLLFICHYCNFRRKPLATCPNCSSSSLRYLGGGTKRVEAEITRLLPTARLARLDKDSATPAYVTKVLQDLQNGELDILIGTQMIAKGLDLPSLDLVGVVLADTMLHIPDYTAGERTVQLLSQVSGRAGRHERPGQVIIQSYTPEHPAILAAAKHEHQAFVENELAGRQLLGYPPFVHLLKLSCSLATQAASASKAQKLADQLKKQSGIAIVGPAPSFLERVGGGYRWQLIVKSKDRKKLLEVAKSAPSGWTIDLDPINLL
jgi:primosomal protein N' (replication factor Y) (superfamily II helicase)